MSVGSIPKSPVHRVSSDAIAVDNGWRASSRCGGNDGGATAAVPFRVKQLTGPGALSEVGESITVVSPNTHRSPSFAVGTLKPSSRAMVRVQPAGAVSSRLV